MAVSAAGAGKTVAAGTGISVVSTPTTVTINNTYTLPTASSSILGGIKVGSGLAIDTNGVLSTAFNIPKASPTLLGGVKVGTGLSIDSTGVLSTILPVASSIGLGGIKVGSGLAIDGSGVLSVTAGGTGTVTSVGLSLPNIFSISGSPVTGAGTLSGTLASQSANLVFAGPTTGIAASPTFRSLVAGDIPSLPASQITSGALATARGGTGLDTSTAANGQLLIGNGTGLALATLTAGSGIAVTNAAGGITVAANATNASAVKLSDTTMTTANTFYDGPTISCVAGTWLLLASCTVLATTTAGKVTGKLWDGTTVLTSTEQPQVVSTADSLTVAYVVSPASTTIYKMSVASTVAGNTLKAACPDNGAGNNATWIVAIRIA